MSDEHFFMYLWPFVCLWKNVYSDPLKMTIITLPRFTNEEAEDEQDEIIYPRSFTATSEPKFEPWLVRLLGLCLIHYFILC